MMTPIVARTSCVMVSVTLIPSFSARSRASRLRRRKRPDGHAHTLNGEDLDDLTAWNGRRGRRGERLNGTVIRQYDRAARAFANAYDDARAAADQIAQRGRLPPFGAPQRGKYRERDCRPAYPEQERDEGLSDGAKTERDRAEQPSDAEHRNKAQQHRHGRRVVRVAPVDEGHVDVLEPHRDVHPHMHAATNA